MFATILFLQKKLFKQPDHMALQNNITVEKAFGRKERLLLNSLFRVNKVDF